MALEAIGFLELNSIARGIEAADRILKTADTRLLYAKAGCPGKYTVLFSGEVAAVTSSLEAGKQTGGHFVVDSVVIPRVHPQVIKAINMPVDVNALGVMEYFTITAAVYGADAAVKAAEVDLMDVRLGTGIGGKSFVVLTGEVASVETAVEAGLARAAEDGIVVSSVVIPNPRRAIFESLM